MARPRPRSAMSGPGVPGRKRPSILLRLLASVLLLAAADLNSLVAEATEASNENAEGDAPPGYSSPSTVQEKKRGRRRGPPPIATLAMHPTDAGASEVVQSGPGLDEEEGAPRNGPSAAGLSIKAGSDGSVVGEGAGTETVPATTAEKYSDENFEYGTEEFTREVTRRLGAGVPQREVEEFVKASRAKLPEVEQYADDESFDYGSEEFYNEVFRRRNAGVPQRQIEKFIQARQFKRKKSEVDAGSESVVGELPKTHMGMVLVPDTNNPDFDAAAVQSAIEWIDRHGSLELKIEVGQMSEKNVAPEDVTKFLLEAARKGRKMMDAENTDKPEKETLGERRGFLARNRSIPLDEDTDSAEGSSAQANGQKEQSSHPSSQPTANVMYTYEQKYQDMFHSNNAEYDPLRFDPYSLSGAPLGGWGRATRSRLATLPIRLVSDFDGGMDLVFRKVDGDNVSDGLGEEEDEQGRMEDKIEVSQGGSGSEERATEVLMKSNTKPSPSKDILRSAGPHVFVHDATGQRFVCRVYEEDELVVPSRLDSAFLPAVTIWDDDGRTGLKEDQGSLAPPGHEHALHGGSKLSAKKDDFHIKKKFQFSIGTEGGNVPEGVRDSVTNLLRKIGMKDAADALARQLNPEAFLNGDMEFDVDVHVLDMSGFTTNIHRRDEVGDGAGGGVVADELADIIKAAAVGAGIEGVSDASMDGKGSIKRAEKLSTPAQLTTSEVSEVLGKLRGLCSQLHLGWWSYEWCHQEHVRQFHVSVRNQASATGHGPKYNVEDVTLVGKFGGEMQIIYPKGVYGGEIKLGKTHWLKVDNDGNTQQIRVTPHTAEEDSKYSSVGPAGDNILHSKQKVDDKRKKLGHGGPIVRQTFDGGDYCDETKRQRHISVELRCCTEEEIDLWLESKKQRGAVDAPRMRKRGDDTPRAVLVGVQEDETCKYRSRVCTPVLCPELVDVAKGSDAAEQAQEEGKDDPIGTLLNAILGHDMVEQAGQVQVFFPDDDTGRAFDDLVNQAENGEDFINDPNFQVVKEALRKMQHTRSKKLNVKDIIGEDNQDISGVRDASQSSSVLEVNGGESIRVILARTLGKRPCLMKNLGWWTYEFCHAKGIRQYHANNLIDANTGLAKQKIETEHLLGVYEGSGAEDFPDEEEHLHVINATTSATDFGFGRGKGAASAKNAGTKNEKQPGGNGAVYVQEYMHGDMCDHEDVAESVIKGGNIVHGSVERSSSVRFSCGKQWELIDIKEDSTCHYILDVTIPELCQHALFKAPVTKTQVVKCLPV